jgi:hypothetical protein
MPLPQPTQAGVLSEGTLIPPVVVIGSYLTAVLLDAQGDPLPGVAVSIASTRALSVTDALGRFSLPTNSIDVNRVTLNLNGPNLNDTVVVPLPEDIAAQVATHQVLGKSNESIDRLWAVQLLSTIPNQQSTLPRYSWSQSLGMEAINPSVRKLEYSDLAIDSPLPGSVQGGAVVISGRCKRGSIVSISSDLSSNSSTECVGGNFSVNLSPDSPDGLKRINIVQRGSTSQYVGIALDVLKDTEAPLALVSAPSPLVTVGPGSATFDVTFQDSGSGLASITLTTGAVQLIKSGSADCSTIGVSGSNPSKRQITVSGCTGDGAISIKIPAGAAVDSAGNPSLERLSEPPLTILSAPPSSTSVNLAPILINMASETKYNSQLPLHVDFSIIDANSASEVSCTERLYIASTPANVFRTAKLSQIGTSGSELRCQAVFELVDSLLANPPETVNLAFVTTDSKGASSTPREIRLSLRDKWDTALLFRFDSNTANSSHYGSISGWPGNVFSPTGSVTYSTHQSFGMSASYLNQGISLQNNLVHELFAKRATIELAIASTQDTNDKPLWLLGKNGSWKIEVQNDSSSNGRVEAVVFSVWNLNAWKSVVCARGDFPDSEGYTHIATTFDLGSMNLFVNGRRCALGTINQTSLAQNTNPILLGSTLRVSLDELRVSRTIRYRENFTPPNAVHTLEPF